MCSDGFEKSGVSAGGSIRSDLMKDQSSADDLHKLGRPRRHADLNAARRAANRAAAARAAAAGFTQRSVSLPAVLWTALRQVRDHGETSDAQTIIGLITSAAAS